MIWKSAYHQLYELAMEVHEVDKALLAAKDNQISLLQETIDIYKRVIGDAEDLARQVIAQKDAKIVETQNGCGRDICPPHSDCRKCR